MELGEGLEGVRCVVSPVPECWGPGATDLCRRRVVMRRWLSAAFEDFGDIDAEGGGQVVLVILLLDDDSAE